MEENFSLGGEHWLEDTECCSQKRKLLILSLKKQKILLILSVGGTKMNIVHPKHQIAQISNIPSLARTLTRPDMADDMV